MGAKLGDLENVLVEWTGQANAKNETTDEDIREQTEVLGQQMSLTSCVA
jgi:hypothetical protein